MRRRYRILTTVIIAAASIVVVLALSLVGTVSEGPIVGGLRRIGTAIGGLESAIVHRVRGPGRKAGLMWLEPYRADPARLRDPDVVLLGAFDHRIPRTLEGVTELEESLETTLPLIHGYTAWGDKPDQRFPSRFVQAVWELGSIPVVTWEPWLTDFENRLHPGLPLRAERDQDGLKAIAGGDYDFYIDAWAADAAAFGHPFFLRFAHEMNDPYRYPWGVHNNHPFDFIAAWQHVRDRFAAAGADNVIWVWSPHVAYEGYAWFYPGDDAVDWVAAGALNYGTVANWSQWWTFKEVFGDRYEPLAELGKPIMIAEFGSLAVGGDRHAWYDEALTDLPAQYPAVRALLFFNVIGDATVTYQELDWSFTGDDTLAALVAARTAGWAP